MPRAQRLNRLLPAALVAAGLSACVVEPATSPRPQPAPVRPAPSPETAPETAKSAAARLYFAEVQRVLLSQGLLRTDTGARDAPFGQRQLTENFIRIALYDEYSRSAGAFTRGETPSILRKWVAPVRMQIHFGASVPEARRATDRARISSYLARLSGVTGHPMSVVESGGNFSLYIVSEDEREALAPQLRADMPGLSAKDIHDVTAMPRTTYCLVYALSKGSSGVYARAVAVVRAEHPDLLRQSCFHEEIAQGLGLPNDYPRARPSIFNDDEEFALLTPMDEMMLKMLYDPSLRPGMAEAEARPIVESLARRLLGGDT
ncbi:DUF2927 domain-containing protein [Pseudogemmobacter sonorensis]|uniref:DUF2927 domain-containing protein n=1 Tax=Pseudogemmobacter sonorensis TaxID=2989681 RepID=UPI003F6682D8